MAIFGGINWMIYARKKYEGPRLRVVNDEDS